MIRGVCKRLFFSASNRPSVSIKKISSSKSYSHFLDLPPPPDPPPGQGLRQQIVPGQRGGSAERKGSSLERQHAPNVDETKSSLDRQARTSLEWQRQTQEWISSTDRQEDFRKAQHKQAFGSGAWGLHQPRRCKRLLDASQLRVSVPGRRLGSPHAPLCLCCRGPGWKIRKGKVKWELVIHVLALLQQWNLIST